MLLRILSLSVICWLAGKDQGLSADKAAAPDDITVLQDIRYCEGSSKQWRLDLAMKKAPEGKLRPAIVVIHPETAREIKRRKDSR